MVAPAAIPILSGAARLVGLGGLREIAKRHGIGGVLSILGRRSGFTGRRTPRIETRGARKGQPMQRGRKGKKRTLYERGTGFKGIRKGRLATTGVKGLGGYGLYAGGSAVLLDPTRQEEDAEALAAFLSEMSENDPNRAALLQMQQEVDLLTRQAAEAQFMDPITDIARAEEIRGNAAERELELLAQSLLR